MVLRNWIIVGQGLTMLAVGAGGGCFDFFYLSLRLLKNARSLLSHKSKLLTFFKQKMVLFLRIICLKF